MKNKIIFLIAAFLCLLIGGSGIANDFKAKKLPPPDHKRYKMLSVVDALKERKSTKAYKTDQLHPKDLANIMWAAAGINRPEATTTPPYHKLTIPTAMNKQNIAVYAVLADGVYIYEPVNNELLLLVEGDYRAKTTTGQAYVYDAPLDLIYVSDLSKLCQPGGPYNCADCLTMAEAYYTAAISVGCAVQNVYLYVAGTRKLGAVCRTSIDKAYWHDLLGLTEGQVVLATQTVGYPTE